MRTAGVPVEILRLQIERVAVGQKPVERHRDGLDRGIIQIGGRIQGSAFRPRLELRHFVVAHVAPRGCRPWKEGPTSRWNCPLTTTSGTFCSANLRRADGLFDYETRANSHK